MKDPNDLHRAGINIRELADSAKPYEPKGNGKANDQTSFELVCLTNIEPLPVEWLWEDRLARGHLTLFASDPGMGKSQITLDLAARLSRGALATRPDDADCIIHLSL